MAESPSKEEQALLDALQGLLMPLGKLLVEKGVHYAEVEERLKMAMILAAREAALKATPQALAHRLVSRIATTTGINRREVTRLVHHEVPEAAPRRSQATQVFARWTTDPDFLLPDGAPKPLARRGAAPSFETLAGSITRDVHPRSLLDELIRLELVSWHEGSDLVEVRREAFAPRDDLVRMLGYLGANVGDHLKSAVHNVLGGQPPQFEQAMYADGLSAASLSAIRQSVAAHWQTLARSLIPELQHLVDADVTPEGLAARPGHVRIGLYLHSDDGLQPVPGATPPKEAHDEQ